MSNSRIAASIFIGLAIFESSLALYQSTSPQIEILDAGVCALIAIAYAIQHLCDSTKLDDNDHNRS